MATTSQITANHQNAQHSTGPRTADGKSASSQNAIKNGLTVSDETLARENRSEIDRLTGAYRQQYPSQSPTAGHLHRLLACATMRQRKLEDKQLELLDTVEIDDPILARVERYRAAAERSFYRALKELQALERNEPNPAPAPTPEVSETKPIKPTMEQLRARFPHADRNELARMRARV